MQQPGTNSSPTWDTSIKKKKIIPAAKKNSFAQTKLGTFLFKKNVATIKKSRNDKKLQKIKTKNYKNKK